MRNRFCRGIVAVIGWVIANWLTQIHHSEIFGRILRRPERNKLSAYDESLFQVLDRALREGHTCLSLESFATRAEAQLGANETAPEAVFNAFQRLQAHGRIRLTDTCVALTRCVVAEETIANGLAQIGRQVRQIHPTRLGQLIESLTVKLSGEQREAVRLIANSPVSILTGAPGTGKTSTVKALLEFFEQSGRQVRLAAPTGRAADRLREVTGHPAQTLHRMLRAYPPATPSIQSRISHVADVIIIDEASMIDVFLMARLVKACGAATKLILVGDVNQLPSIGAGQALFDLIESGAIPVIELRKNFRQAEGSQIIAAAEAIRDGREPDLPAPGQAKSDCYFIEAETAAEAARLVVKAVTRSLPARCGADPYQNIQTLTPKHRGSLGTGSLNDRIQESLRDRKSNFSPTAHSFLPGDRVLHTKNNYQLNVFNGQCGSVQQATSDTVTVKFGSKEVKYSRSSLPQLTPGFAITIHRSQGSEYPFVVIPIHESQQPMLSRELLYTAITRGQQMVFLVGSRRALEMAIETTVRGKLQTGLKQAIKASAVCK